jgi:hypothetical protein
LAVDMRTLPVRSSMLKETVAYESDLRRKLG